MLGAGGTSRATVRKMVKGCAAPAPLPTSMTASLGANDFGTQGLNIHGDTSLVFVPDVNSGTVLTVTSIDVVPSGKDTLGLLGAGFEIAAPVPADTYEVFAVGPCGTRVYVGTVTIV